VDVHDALSPVVFSLAAEIAPADPNFSRRSPLRSLSSRHHENEIRAKEAAENDAPPEIMFRKAALETALAASSGSNMSELLTPLACAPGQAQIHMFCSFSSIFLPVNTVGRPSPDEIIIIFYFLSGNLMFVIKLEKVWPKGSRKTACSVL
jgi:hypothetical protein